MNYTLVVPLEAAIVMDPVMERFFSLASVTVGVSVQIDACPGAGSVRVVLSVEGVVASAMAPTLPEAVHGVMGALERLSAEVFS